MGFSKQKSRTRLGSDMYNKSSRKEENGLNKNCDSEH